MLSKTLTCLWLVAVYFGAVEATQAGAVNVKARALAPRRASRARHASVNRGRGRDRGRDRPAHRSPAPAPARAPNHRAPAPPAAKTPTGGSRGSAPAVAPAGAQAPAAAPPTSVAPSSLIPSLYRQMLASGGQCQNQLDTNPRGYDDGDGSGHGHYCGNTKQNPSFVYWLSNMDVDCDGSVMTGSCAGDPSHSSQTAFQFNGQYSDASRVPYTVINTDRFFSPDEHGIQPFAVVGVYCNNRIVYSVYGDQNSYEVMGEGSLKLAQLCFGDGMTANNGWDNDDVMYFAFTGQAGVDPFAGTNLGALTALGNRLLAGH